MMACQLHLFIQKIKKILAAIAGATASLMIYLGNRMIVKIQKYLTPKRAAKLRTANIKRRTCMSIPYKLA